MKLRNVVATSCLAIASTFALNANAQSFATCVSTDLVQFDGTIVDAALATPELSTLVTALSAADLVDTLDTIEDVTVYAPTNDAFGAIPADILGDLLADVPSLTEVLVYHVSPGRLNPRKFLTTVRRDTLNGQNIFFHRNNGAARVNNAAVDCQGVSTTNGDVYFIDSVLMPEYKTAITQ